MKILIGIPTYDRRIDIELTRTLVHIERSNRYYLDYFFPVSSHLSRNRNMCCLEAIKGDHDYLLFLDSDMGISDENFIDKLLDTAYKYDAKIVGGAYKMKKNNEAVYVAGAIVNDKPQNLKQSFTGLVDVVGTGIMLISGQVLSQMSDPWFTIVDYPKLEVMPEDFNFCIKARQKGFKVALDSRFGTNHYGQTAFSHL